MSVLSVTVKGFAKPVRTYSVVALYDDLAEQGRIIHKEQDGVRVYRNRDAIERMFGRLKDFRRVATRYDRLAQNFVVAVCLAASVRYWL